MKTRILAKAVLFNEAGKFLAVRRSKTDDRRPGQWDLPGGGVEAGERIEEALVREIKEEVGITIDITEAKVISADHKLEPELNVVWIFFAARPNDTKITLSFEHDMAKWMSLEEGVEAYQYQLQRNLLKRLLQNDLYP